MRKILPIDDQTDHLLLTGKSTANQHMTHQSFTGDFIIGGYFIFMHIGEYGFEDLLIFGSTESAVCIGNDGMGASGIETGDDITVSISSYGVLRFITIVEGFLHAYNRLHAFINVFRIKPTNPDQMIADLLFLEMQLLGVGECLQLTAAALSVVCTFRLHTKRRRL